MRILPLLITLVALCGCVEYRLERSGGDRYYGWAHTKPYLDPKIGPRTKVFATDRGNLRPYLAIDFRRKDLRIGVGVIQYLDDYSSLEIGYRVTMFEDDRFDLDKSFDLDGFEDPPRLFYIGGVIRW